MQSEQFQLHATIEQRHWWFVGRRRILRRVINSVLPPSPQTTIVDVGCGTGANLASLADQYSCIGIDTSSEAVRLAAGRFPRVRFVCGVAHEMSEILAQAQLVMLTDVLEHVSDDFQMLSELLAVTSPGTYFLITVPADPGLWSEHDRSFGHYRRYEAPRLERVWQGLPVTPIFVSHFNSRLYPAVKAVRGWNRWRGHALGAAGTDFVMPWAPTNWLLTQVFAGEGRKLAALAKGRQRATYPAGVSLMALVRREAGTIEPRRKPGYLSSDMFDPEAEQFAEPVAV